MIEIEIEIEIEDEDENDNEIGNERSGELDSGGGPRGDGGEGWLNGDWNDRRSWSEWRKN